MSLPLREETRFITTLDDHLVLLSLPQCPRCDSVNVGWKRKRKHSAWYRCRMCGKWFNDRDFPQAKMYPDRVVETALHLRRLRMTYRGIAGEIRALYGYAPFPSTIYDWCMR